MKSGRGDSLQNRDFREVGGDRQGSGEDERLREEYRVGRVCPEGVSVDGTGLIVGTCPYDLRYTKTSH